MRFEYLEYLVAIDKFGSISRAADSLYVTQPALSTALNCLERELGFSVFKRSNMGVAPTQNGRKVVEDAKRILEIYERWHSLPYGDGEQLIGTVSVAASPSLCATIMINILAQLKLESPGINVVVSEVRTRNVLNHLRGHKSDIVLCSIPAKTCIQRVKEIEAMGYECRPLQADKMKLVMSSVNPLASKKTLTREDLEKLTFVAYDKDGDDTTSAIYDIVPEGNIKYTVTKDSMIWNMVSTNMACALGPTMPVLSLQYANAAQFAFADVEGLDEININMIISPKPENLSTCERKVLEVVREVYKMYNESADHEMAGVIPVPMIDEHSGNSSCVEQLRAFFKNREQGKAANL